MGFAKRRDEDPYAVTLSDGYRTWSTSSPAAPFPVISSLLRATTTCIPTTTTEQDAWAHSHHRGTDAGVDSKVLQIEPVLRTRLRRGVVPPELVARSHHGRSTQGGKHHPRHLGVNLSRHRVHPGGKRSPPPDKILR